MVDHQSSELTAVCIESDSFVESKLGVMVNLKDVEYGESRIPGKALLIPGSHSYSLLPSCHEVSNLIFYSFTHLVNVLLHRVAATLT